MLVRLGISIIYKLGFAEPARGERETEREERCEEEVKQRVRQRCTLNNPTTSPNLRYKSIPGSPIQWRSCIPDVLHESVKHLSLISVELGELGEVLDESLLGGEAVEGGIRTSLSADESGEGERGVVSGEETVLVDVSNVQLNGSMILGDDKVVGGGAVEAKQGKTRKYI